MTREMRGEKREKGGEMRRKIKGKMRGEKREEK